jgi:hypothetical protein
MVQHEDAQKLLEMFDQAHAVTLPDPHQLRKLSIHTASEAARQTSNEDMHEGDAILKISRRRGGFIRLKTLGSGQFGRVELMAAAPNALGKGSAARHVAVKVLTGNSAELQGAFMQEVWCTIFYRTAHSRMLLDPTPAQLNL